MSSWQAESVTPPYGSGPGGYREPPTLPRRRRRWGRWVLGAFLALLLLVVGCYFYLDSRLHRVDAFGDYPGRPAASAGTNWLIVGSDSRQGLSNEQKKQYATGDAAGGRTDTMMLLHTGSGGTTLVSLPRDSYVPIPGHGHNKLNAAFAYGGPKLLIQTVEMATGLRINHYAEIGFGGFVGMVDAVGGVNMCITQKMKDPKAGLNLKPGCQQLNGGQALGYVRTRAFASADLQRVQDQRKFLAALVHKATSLTTVLNPFRIIPFTLKATSDFSVDNGDHLYNLVGFARAMQGVTKGSAVTTTVPIGGTGSESGVGEYLVWDHTKARALFNALREDKAVPKDATSS
jgi:LCP family protein required for cell wall assembly